MHGEVSQFIEEVKEKYPKYFYANRVLEVGSLNINGTIRSMFVACNYLGIDLGKGPGVDLICPIHELDHYQTYDTVISTEMLEHDQYWQLSLRRMYDTLKPGGVLILTCAGPKRHEHGTTRTTPGDAPFTNDYYRNITLDDFSSVLPADYFSESKLEYRRADADLCFYGIKKPNNDTQ